jgi:hypothetical protein
MKRRTLKRRHNYYGWPMLLAELMDINDTHPEAEMWIDRISDVIDGAAASLVIQFIVDDAKAAYDAGGPHGPANIPARMVIVHFAKYGFK